MRYAAVSGREGFTLIEMMVVVVIVGVVVTMALPRVGRMLAANAAQQASSMMASDIRRAYTIAAQKRSPVRISIDTAGKKFLIRNRARDTTYHQTLYNTGADVMLSRLGTDDTTFIVWPNGLAENGVTIVVRTPGGARQIAMTRAGQVRISTTP